MWQTLSKLLRCLIGEMETLIGFAVSGLWVAFAWVFWWNNGTKKAGGEAMEKLSWEARRKGGGGETRDGGRAFREGAI